MSTLPSTLCPTHAPTGWRDVLAVASTSTTVLRSDCALLEGRDDLTPAGPGGPASPPAVSATRPAERGQIWS